VNALLQSLELRHSDARTGHFCLFHCLVIGHSKHQGVQRVYCDPFPKKLFHGANRQDLVFIRPPGIENGGFVLKPDSVWYCRVLLLFSFSAMTDTGSRSFDCALISVMERYEGARASGNYLMYLNYWMYLIVLSII
jgi:hypothetical protein